MDEEENCIMCVENITGNKKHWWEMLIVVVREFRILVGRVCCDGFNGFCTYIFNISILLWFQKVVWGALGHEYCGCFCGIVAITILIW